MFLAINPGIQCQAPYLTIGQLVCINSPLLTGMRINPNMSYSMHPVQAGETLDMIANIYSPRCTPASIAPANVAAINNITGTDPDTPLVEGSQIIIPCLGKAGILDCGCSTSLSMCGADYVTYPSYCDAVCNYATPQRSGSPCAGCNAACVGRTGLAPLSGYGCTWSQCPYPTWPPPTDDCANMVGTAEGKCCTYVSSTCDSVCTAMMGTSTSAATNYNNCYNTCLCCSRLPCAGSSCTAPSSCVYASPRKCYYSGGKYLWNCSYFPAADPLP
eukprot:TRINITY_DN63772_c0_g1_i1.p1 TRINITY_DN63772_c0_g1~~TRINITY_DN63772_c0_g1_i1.p1  ORF type:complete len:273 (+),score=-15.37 TRINITY_DN63772_c0_g1_i1:221-1039(+)